MTVTALSRLPLELILLIVEHAARSEVISGTSWVARLCLVCRVFRRVVTPILYGHITITLDDDDTYECLATTSCMPDTPLVHTRSVLFAHDFPASAYPTTSFKLFACALVNVSAFSGPTRALAELLNHVDGSMLSSAYLIEIDAVPRFAKVQRLVQTLSYLHFVCDASRPDWNEWPDLSSYHVEYLAIDLFAERDTLGVESIDLSTMMRLATSPKRLRRVLLRPRLVQQSDVQRTAQAVVEWATAQRDVRIHIEDTFVSIGVVARAPGVASTTPHAGLDSTCRFIGSHCSRALLQRRLQHLDLPGDSRAQHAAASQSPSAPVRLCWLPVLLVAFTQLSTVLIPGWTYPRHVATAQDLPGLGPRPHGRRYRHEASSWTVITNFWANLQQSDQVNALYRYSISSGCGERPPACLYSRFCYP